MSNDLTHETTAKFFKSKLFVLSLAASIVCLFFLFPWDYLRGVGPYWNNPANEVNIGLAALRYYIAENHWFPLGLIKHINAPEGINILYENAVPFTSFFAKIANQFFGIKINSIYIFCVACAILQGISFAYFIVALNVRKTSIIILGSILGMLMPAYLWRLESSVSCPHFLICFALVYYFIISGKNNSQTVVRHAIVSFAVMLILGNLINIYITAMIIPYFAVALLFAILAKRISAFYAIKVVFFIAVAMALTDYLFGYFYGNKVNAAVGGFNFFSMNILSPLDPAYSSLFKRLMPNLVPVDATGGQIGEGMQYLGIGCLVLIPLAIWLNGRETIKSIKYHYLLTALLLGMAIFSLSNKIYFEHKLLLEYPIPKFLEKLVEIFRASGRFFWPVGYFLVMSSIVIIAKKAPRSAPYILCVAIILQVADTHDLRKELWDILEGVNAEGVPAGKYVSPYTVGGVPSTVINRLFQTHKVYKQYPSWWCGGVGNQLFETEVSFIASRYLVTQNSYYTARPNKDCYAEDQEVRSISSLAPDTVYIFGQRYADLNLLHSQGVDLSACRILKNFDIQTPSSYIKNPPIICSEKLKSNPENVLGEIPKGWVYGGLYPIDTKPFAKMPIISKVTSSGELGAQYRAENVIGAHTEEADSRFSSNWLSSNSTTGWVRLDLNGLYNLSQVKILNTHNDGKDNQVAKQANIELYGKDGSIYHINKIKLAEYPQWTSIKVNSHVPVRAVKVIVSNDKSKGTGLNKIQLLGAKEIS